MYTKVEWIPGAKLWTSQVPVEHEALNTILRMSNLPIIHQDIAIMPDVHVGKGAVVGSVIPTTAAIIPSAVGVDIGCGMAAVRLNIFAKDLPDSLNDLRLKIESYVPVGFASRPDLPKMREDLKGHQLHGRIVKHLNAFEKLRIVEHLKYMDGPRIPKQMGTLGGGNHFIELCLDETDQVWMMLHSGSRNIGKVIGECAMYLAREQMKKLKIPFDSDDLCWLAEGTPEFDMYVEALSWAQDYAAMNREVMAWFVMKAIREVLGTHVQPVMEVINCHHNYAVKEVHNDSPVWLTRKGAVSAKEGQLGIIPGSMGAKSFIVRGKGNINSYCSCSHGAGRKLSRGAAKRQFTVDDLLEQTTGVECRKDEGVIDEIPGAYKDIEAVMASQSDLVDILHTLKQVMCIKG